MNSSYASLSRGHFCAKCCYHTDLCTLLCPYSTVGLPPNRTMVPSQASECWTEETGAERIEDVLPWDQPGAKTVLWCILWQGFGLSSAGDVADLGWSRRNVPYTWSKGESWDVLGSWTGTQWSEMCWRRRCRDWVIHLKDLRTSMSHQLNLSLSPAVAWCCSGLQALLLCWPQAGCLPACEQSCLHGAEQMIRWCLYGTDSKLTTTGMTVLLWIRANSAGASSANSDLLGRPPARVISLQQMERWLCCSLCRALPLFRVH